MTYARGHELDEAFVLAKRKMLRADLAVVLFTKQSGKLTVVAKGIQKITSRRISALQTGNLVTISYSKKSQGPLYLSDVSLISHFSELKKSHTKIQQMYTFFYALDSLLPEHQREEAVYRLCKKIMIQLGTADRTFFPLVHALSELFSFLGYGHCQTLDECREKFMEITGKQMPDSII